MGGPKLQGIVTQAILPAEIWAWQTRLPASRSALKTTGEAETIAARVQQ
jgi:hypothetical protein